MYNLKCAEKSKSEKMFKEEDSDFDEIKKEYADKTSQELDEVFEKFIKDFKNKHKN